MREKLEWTTAAHRVHGGHDVAFPPIVDCFAPSDVFQRDSLFMSRSAMGELYDFLH